MTVFNFCGLSDKKFLTLPLANAMSVLGDTLIVTEDTSYRYLMTNDGKIGKVRVLVSNAAHPIDFKNHDEFDEGIDYQYIIYDTFDKLTEDVDLTITVRGKDRTLMPPIIPELTDSHDDEEPKIEAKEVILTAFYSKFEERKQHYRDRGFNMEEKATVIAMKPQHYKWLQMVAETKEIVPLKDTAMLGTLCSLVDDTIRGVKGKGLLELMGNEQ